MHLKWGDSTRNSKQQQRNAKQQQIKGIDIKMTVHLSPPRDEVLSLCIHFNSVTILICSVSISKSDVLRTLARKDKSDTEKRDNVPKLTGSKKAALPKVIENEYL